MLSKSVLILFFFVGLGCLQTSVLGYNYMGSFSNGDFWKQFQHGVRQFEQATRDSMHKMETTFQSWLGGEDDYEDYSFKGGSTKGKNDFETAEESRPSVSDFQTPMFDADIIGSMFGSMRQDWWKGPNVCVSREEIDGSQHNNGTESMEEDDGMSIFGNFHFSSCQQTDVRYICTTKIHSHGVRKTIKVKYECCYGFRRVRGNPGCTEMKMNSIPQTLTDLGAEDFYTLIKSAGLEEKILVQNLTIFAPTNDAVRDYTDDLEEANTVEFYVPPASARRKRKTEENISLREIVLNHITSSIIDTDEIVNEKVLYTDNNNNTLRLNVYPTGGEKGHLVTANCARLTSTNHYATTGIVHLVDRIIKPVSKTVYDIISNDAQFSIFKKMLDESDVHKELTKTGHFTLLAPTDAAFDNMDAAVRSRVIEGNGCGAHVVQQHILPDVLCTSAVNPRVFAGNLNGEVVHIHRNDEDKLSVDGAQIVARDIVGTNGVVHVIDKVLLPDSARPVTAALKARNLTDILELIHESGLAESLDSMTNMTFFAPSNDVLRKVDEQKMRELRSNPNKLRDMILYHTAGPAVPSCDFSNNLILKTGVMDKSVRINLFSTMPFFTGSLARATVQCARIRNFDAHVCGGVVHEVGKMLEVPEASIIDVINKNSNYSVLNRLFKDTSLEKDLQDNGPYTLLAPTDEAFYKLEEEELSKLMNDKKLAVQVLRQHVLPEILCCEGVGASVWPFTSRVETLSGRALTTRRDHGGRIHIGPAQIRTCDHLASNGVVHTINRVIIPQTRRQSELGPFQAPNNPNVDVQLYGV